MKTPGDRSLLPFARSTWIALVWLGAVSCTAIGCCYLPSPPSAPVRPAPTSPVSAPRDPSIAAGPLGGAVDEIERARAATAAHDIDALRALMSSDTASASYALTATESTTSLDTALAAWRAHPEILDRAHEALAHCETETDDDMQFATCEPPYQPGALLLMWVDSLNTNEFVLYNVTWMQ